MPITSSVLKTRRRAFDFEYLGETVNVEYYPAFLSAESIQQIKAMEARVNEARDANDEATAMDALDEMARWMCALLASWDYLEDDGVTMVAIEPERITRALLQFPDFMGEVIRAIMQDRMAGNANGTTPSARSGATSSPMANSTSSPAVSSLNPSRSSSRRVGSRAQRRSNG